MQKIIDYYKYICILMLLEQLYLKNGLYQPLCSGLKE